MGVLSPDSIPGTGDLKKKNFMMMMMMERRAAAKANAKRARQRAGMSAANVGASYCNKRKQTTTDSQFIHHTIREITRLKLSALQVCFNSTKL